MASALIETPAYRNTMAELERVKRLSEQGIEYWMAREIHSVLGYRVWDKFVPVIDRARESFVASGVESSHHIAQTSKLMGGGGGAQREGLDYFLSRGACYLIAMNGDPTKPEIAAAQAYFAMQTRRAEIADRSASDHHRLSMRYRVSDQLKRLSAVAKDVGVKHFAFLNASRLHGFYGQRTVADVKRVKGVPEGEEVLDVINSWELALHEAQIGMARQKILDEGITGEQPVIDTQRKIAESMRQTVKDNLGYGPEHIPCEEPIKAVEKRLKEETKPKRITGPNA